jgi:3-phenylpropionate/trans-cinnamate dioxygenase ferredoxin reductase component
MTVSDRAGAGVPPRRVVIVGAGLAGMAAASELRGLGWDGSIALVGAEDHLPYERPPLSKGVLSGERDTESLSPLGAAWYEEQGVHLFLGRPAERLDVVAREVVLSDGEKLAFDALLLATGGSPRRLPHTPSGRVHYLRTIEDAASLRADVRRGGHLIVVGGGFIGCEVAASARALDSEVTMVEALGSPLERVLGPRLGRVFERIHRDEGVTLRMHESVVAMEDRQERVLVTTTSGARLEGDAALVGIGILPDVRLALDAGLAVGDGVLVDEYCRTSGPGVYAAGDLASHLHPLFNRRLRVEHYDNALKQGAAAGASMLGASSPYVDPHWFWSDQYGCNLQTVGLPLAGDQTIERGRPEERDGIVFSLAEGVLVGAVGLNRGRDVRRARKLIAARARPPLDLLIDEDVDLRTLG